MPEFWQDKAKKQQNALNKNRRLSIVYHHCTHQAKYKVSLALVRYIFCQNLAVIAIKTTVGIRKTKVKAAVTASSLLR